MHHHAPPEPLRRAPRHGHRVALHHEVELVRPEPQQDVPHSAPDHVHGVLALQRGHGRRPPEVPQYAHIRHLRGWLPSYVMSSDRPRWYRRRIVIVLSAVVVLLVCAAAVFALTRPGDVFNKDVEFRPEPEQTNVPQAKAPKKKGKKGKKVDPLSGFTWAQYGYSRDRRRYLPTDPSVAPPFKRRWSWDANVLLEFPPIIVGQRLFTVRNDGEVVKLDANTGRVHWRRDMGYLSASSPAYGDKKIVVTILERTKGGPGKVAAIWARSGKVSWSKDLPSRSESSPLVVDHRVYFGTEDGTVYAMSVDDGSIKWKFRAGGAVKGGPALVDGKLYFGTYGGNVYAISQQTGKQVWHTGTSGANFGLSAGNFYATPAVAFGRVYIGNTDGNMYSFSAATGKLAWRRGTGVLRVRLTGRRPGAGRPADRVLRQLRRHVLRARRPLRRHPLDTQGRRQDLRRRHDHRRHRLLLELGQARHHGAGRAHRPGGLEEPARRVQPGGLGWVDGLLDRLLIGRRVRAAVRRPGARAGRALGQEAQGGQAAQARAEEEARREERGREEEAGSAKKKKHAAAKKKQAQAKKKKAAAAKKKKQQQAAAKKKKSEKNSG